MHWVSPLLHSCLLSLGSPVGAPTSIAIAPVSMEGETSPVSPEALDDSVQQGLHRGTLELEPLEGSCTAPACWIDLARQRGLGHLLLPRAQRRGPDHILRIDVVTTANGEEVASVERTCEICGEDELLETMADLAAELDPRLARLGTEPTVVMVDGIPRGATVIVDGLEVGTVPWQGEVTPGEHEVRVLREGFLPETRTLSATAGIRERLHVELRPLPPPEVVEPPANRRRPLVGAGVGLLGVGVAGVGIGAGLLVLDERPYRRDCPDDVVDVNGRCPRMYEATAPAAIALGVGGAALIAGTILLVRGLRGNPRRSTKAMLVPSPRGLALHLRL